MTSKPTHILRLTCLALAVGLGGACAQQKSKQLGGSIAAALNMHFDSVRAYRIGPRLIFAFQLAHELPPEVVGFGAPVQNQVLRVVFNTARQALAEGVDIQLVGNDDYPNASVSRYTIAVQGVSPVQDEAIAPLAEGTIYFDHLGKKGGDQLKGHLAGKLTDGRDFLGDFDTVLVDP